MAPYTRVQFKNTSLFLFFVLLSGCDTSTHKKPNSHQLQQLGAGFTLETTALWFYSDMEGSRPRVDDSNVATISQLESLRYLDLSQTKVSNHGFVKLLSELKRLEFVKPPSSIKPTGMLACMALPRLVNLELHESNINDRVFSLVKDSHLEWLDLSRTSVSGLFLDSTTFHSLKYLNLSETSLSETTCNALNQCPSLVMLNIASVPMSPKSFRTIELPNLTTLGLEHHSITTELLDSLDHFGNLQEIYIGNTGPTGRKTTRRFALKNQTFPYLEDAKQDSDGVRFRQ